MPFDSTPQTDTDLEPWQRVLLDAAGRVRQGWCQGDYEDSQGGVCAMQATTLHGFMHGLTARRHLKDYLERTGQCRSIPRWNDQPGRTAEEVATAMERAAREGEK